ncbi:MCE family protein [Pseudonocardiaceae bacterium YIM PH 21723]|nr:MCE family protein [Pseudonocardiaceae bacterium YIM PH 21723]
MRQDAAPAVRDDGRREVKRPLLTITTVLTVGLCTTGCGALRMQNIPAGEIISGSGYRLNAEFQDAGGLPQGGQVKIGQAVIGRVVELESKDFTAKVVLSIKDDITLPKGTTASLEQSSVLGEEYVALHRPNVEASADHLVEGDTIGLDKTRRGPDVESTLVALGGLVGGNGIDQVQTIVTELNTALGGREQTVRDTLERMNTVAASLDSHKGELSRTLDALNGATKSMAADKETLQAALTDLSPAINVLNQESAQFKTLLTNTNNLAANTNAMLGESKDNAQAVVQNLDPVLGKLAAYDQRIGQVLDAIHFMTKGLAINGGGDYINVRANLDAPEGLMKMYAAGQKLMEPFEGVAGLVKRGAK